VKALVNIGAPAVDPLLIALSDVNELIRQLAAIALGKIVDARSVVALCLALEDENQHVRMNAADAIKRFGDPDALVRRILLNTAMPLQARQAALNSLRRANRFPPGSRYRRQPSDAHRYCEQMKDDDDIQVREAAAEMLRYLYGDTLVRSSEETGRDLLTPSPGDERTARDRGLLRSVEAPPSEEAAPTALLRWLRRKGS
jgi:HEAT repeat protein